ncbi:MAG: OadG family protein [Treponema sp.]|nr:OadG family protein [Spirochaetia bacterium]MDY2839587.1 OadG family protein [Treponema sp.]MDY5123209.1 OadG family protein [Treponema sp.]
MTITGMLGQSGLLTLLGMCVVFGFIIILILCMKLLQVVVHALKLDKVEQKDTTASANTTSVTDEKAVVAAIAAAIREKK